MTFQIYYITDLPIRKYTIIYARYLKDSIFPYCIAKRLTLPDRNNSIKIIAYDVFSLRSKNTIVGSSTERVNVKFDTLAEAARCYINFYKMNFEDDPSRFE